MKQSMSVLVSSQTSEWYTPQLYTDMARAVMGNIDLDPASCSMANEWICADSIYTIADNGLSKPWRGNVWLNPPRGKLNGKSSQAIWADKLCQEHEAGRVEQAILLTRCMPGYKWWDTLFQSCPVCIMEGRISFVAPDGSAKGKDKAGASFWYFGWRLPKFRGTFSRIGRVIVPNSSVSEWTFRQRGRQ